MRKRLKEICDYISRGATPDYVDESPNKVMNQATFSKGFIDESNVRFSSKAPEYAQIHKGDLLMASTGGGVLGKVAYYDKNESDFYADSHVSILRNSKGKNSMKFLYYWFSTRYDEINETMVKGSTNQTELQRNYLVNYEIDIPSLEVQQRIVSYLDDKTAKIDKAVSLLQKKRDAYTRLKTSIINRAVTRGLNTNVKLKDSGVDWIGMIPENWEVLRLKDVSILYPMCKRNSYSGNVSFVPMESLRCGEIDLKEIPFEYALGKYNYFENGDLLIAKVTPCFENGNISLADGLLQGIGFGSSEIFVLKTTPKQLLNKFMFYVSFTESFKARACSTMHGVGGLKRIDPLFMRTYELSIPPITEQRTIADYLDTHCTRIDHAISIVDKQIDAYTRLKKSLINEVVTGKRKV